MKNRLTSILLAISIVFSVMPFFSLQANAAGVKPSGSGTAADPYKIGDASELIWLRDTINGGNTQVRDSYVELTNDITLTGTWTPINDFRGTFDGRNHTISGLYISEPVGSSWTGFIRHLNNGTIRNLHVKGSVNGANDVGGILAQLNNSNMENCSFEGTVSLVAENNTEYNIGGLIGVVSGTSTLKDSHAILTGTTAGGRTMAGLISTSQRGEFTMERCYATATFYMTKNYVTAGLLGWGDSQLPFLMKDCYADVKFTGSSTSVMGATGMIVAQNYQPLTLNNCHVYTRTENAHGGTLPIELVRKGTNATITNNRQGTVAYQGTVKQLSNTTNSTYLATAANFKLQSTFPTYDFTNTWEITNGKYPTLKQRVDLESQSRRTLYVYDNGEKSFNLPDYFSLVNSKDKKYNQDDCFTYTITQNQTVDNSYVDPVTEETVGGNVTLASLDTVDNDGLVLNGEVGKGTYNIALSATDASTERTNKFGTFSIPLSVVVKHKVPVPQVKATGIGYSRALTLDYIPLTDEWGWADGSICPREGRSYNAYYTYDEGMLDYYDFSDLTAAGIAYTVDETNHRVIVQLDAQVVTSDDSLKVTDINVTNADTGAPIQGAVVDTQYDDEFEAPTYYYVTDENGLAKGELSPGYRDDITVTKDGFTAASTAEEPVFIDKSKAKNTLNFALVPVRHSFTLPAVIDRDTGDELADMLVSVKRLPENAGDTALAWNNGDSSLTADAKSNQVLPDGKYLLSPNTYGYTKDDKLWAVVSGENITYYTDSACTAEAAEAVLRVNKMTEPLYHVQINKDAGSDTGYTVTVDLSNIKATYGTFGLRWDKNLFDLSGVTLSNELSEHATVEEIYGAAYADDTERIAAANTNGYYDFIWMTDTEDTVFDTETAAKTVARLTFDIKDKNRTDEITVDSFGIKPWSETAAAKANAASLGAEDEDDTYMYWRETDADNAAATLKEGRIVDYNSAVKISEATPISSTVETGGFFQGWVNGDLSDPINATAYDIMSEIQYGFKITNAVIRFHAFNSVTEEDLGDVLIRMFNSYQQIVGNDKTDENGILTYSVNTTGKLNPTFTYNAALNGYWPIPLSGLVSDRPNIEAETAKVTEVEVPMEQKIYHKPLLKMNQTGSGPEPETLALVSDAELGGEKYAYNDRPYHFRVRAARGYRILQYPTQAEVFVNGNKIADLTPDVNGLFTLDEANMRYENNSDLCALTASELAALKTGDTDYADWDGVQPDEEGYRGYNMIVKFDHYEVTELEYIVEGETNDACVMFIAHQRKE